MTERRRKTRKKDLTHGDLFHVYIASDTPPEVCEFLSRLKQQGDFSYEILQIIEEHVKGIASAGATVQKTRAESAKADLPVSPSEEEPAKGTETLAPTTPVGLQSVQADVQESTPETTDASPAAEASPDTTPAPQSKLDPIQLLRQQRRAWVANSSNSS